MYIFLDICLALCIQRRVQFMGTWSGLCVHVNKIVFLLGSRLSSILIVDKHKRTVFHTYRRNQNEIDLRSIECNHEYCIWLPLCSSYFHMSDIAAPMSRKLN